MHLSSSYVTRGLYQLKGFSRVLHTFYYRFLLHPLLCSLQGLPLGGLREGLVGLGLREGLVGLGLREGLVGLGLRVQGVGVAVGLGFPSAGKRVGLVDLGPRAGGVGGFPSVGRRVGFVGLGVVLHLGALQHATNPSLFTHFPPRLSQMDPLDPGLHLSW